ncbi:hypothetical protein ACPPVV_10520 [Rhodanobacter sp. Col0626]|uniref:hypothetical protein n=1 Tax=Rhodanobacter sp. Col0626 TaxID=3415679 RepID=UPI003CF6B491
MPNPRRVFMLCTAIAGLLCLPAAQGSAQTPQAARHEPAAPHDGQHDFDFEIGTWKTHLKRLVHPLSGSNEWAAYEGVTTVRKVWDGRANLVELTADGPAGHFEGLNLRLYNPQSRQWSLNFASSRGGTLGQPTIGGFIDGHGEFYDQEDLDGRAIFVRFTITPVDADTIHFEQAFSDDGGKTWEVNWVATDKRLK